MSNITAALETSTLGLHPLAQYEPLIGTAATERILKKAGALPVLHVVHISSTFYGGGVTEILTPLTLMMNTLGIKTGWRMIQGTPSFFAVTKKLHNMLQGQAVDFSDADKAVYEQVVFENATRMHIADCDAVIVHDPQPLPLIQHLRTRDAPWIWQCHVDLSCPDSHAWAYVRPFIEQYHTAIFSLPEYAKELSIDQR